MTKISGSSTENRTGLGLPKREVARDGRASLPRDMVAAVGYENNATNQRYHYAVDRAGIETRNLSIQIRTVFSTVDTLQGGGKQVGDKSD